MKGRGLKTLNLDASKEGRMVDEQREREAALGYVILGTPSRQSHPHGSQDQGLNTKEGMGGSRKRRIV